MILTSKYQRIVNTVKVLGISLERILPNDKHIPLALFGLLTLTALWAVNYLDSSLDTRHSGPLTAKISSENPLLNDSAYYTLRHILYPAEVVF